MVSAGAIRLSGCARIKVRRDASTQCTSGAYQEVAVPSRHDEIAAGKQQLNTTPGSDKTYPNCDNSGDGYHRGGSDGGTTKCGFYY